MRVIISNNMDADFYCWKPWKSVFGCTVKSGDLEFLLIYGYWSCLPVLKKGTTLTTDCWVPQKISTTDNTYTSGCKNSINYDGSVQLKLEGWLCLCFIPVHNFIGNSSDEAPFDWQFLWGGTKLLAIWERSL